MAAELREWAEGVPGTVRVSDAAPRERAKIAGMVRRITVRPVEGLDALEVVLSDGTGDLSARWLGRRSIRGMVLGSKVVVEGVVGSADGVKQIVNPMFEFA